VLLPSGPPWIRRLIIATVAVVVLVGAYALAGFVGVPRWLRSGATDYVRTHYHRALSLGEIHFNPFSLTLDVRDISFPDDDSTPMLSASALHVQLRFASLWRRAASFREIVLDRPFARVLVRRDGALNLADLARPLPGTSPKPPATPAAQAAPMRLIIDRLSVTEGRTTYEDRSRSTPFRAELLPITFDLRDFSTIGTAANEYSLDFATPLAEHFHWEGTLGVEPLASRGRFRIDALRVRTLWSYLSQALHFEVSSGVIALQGGYALAAGTPQELRVDVNRLTVSDLGLRPRGTPADYIHLGLIDVGGTHLDFPHRSIVVDTVRVAGGKLDTWIEPDGTPNVMALIAPVAPPAASSAAPSSDSSAAAPPGASAATAANASWSFAAPDISVTGLDLHAEDRRLAPAAVLDVGNIEVHVHGFHAPGDATLAISAGADIDHSGRLAAQGSYALGSPAAHAELQLSRIDLTALQPYVAQQSALNLLSGLLTTKLSVDRAANGALSAAGDVAVTHLRTVDQQLRQDFVTWDRLSIEGIKYRSQPAAFSIREIVAVKPYARVIIAADRSVNIREALSPAHARSLPSPGAPAAGSGLEKTSMHAGGTQKAQAAGTSMPAMPIAIGRVRISNASARYTDLWIEPHFTLAIQELSGYITGMSSDPRSRAKIQLEGKVDRYAPISISGELNLLAAQAYTDMKMSFQGVELTTATPYSAHFAGYKIEKGKISADITYHIENGSLSANHHIVIDQLQLGDRVESADAVKLPLKLAVALLKDRNGVIDLGLPVTGSLSDPQFRLGPLIWKVVLNVLTKAATAPFEFLGRLFGGGPDIKFIDFDAGSSSLDASDRQRLTAITKALQDRPNLELDVPSAYTPDLDGMALARQLLDRKLLALRAAELTSRKRGAPPPAPDESALAAPAERFRLLVAEYRTELGPKATLPAESQAILDARKKKGTAAPPLDPAIAELQSALLERVKISDDDLQALGRHRARAIQEVLLGDGKIPPARLFVLNTAPTAAAGGRVRLQLGLK
jgi:uncharacterized protein involved in outer membrane biogenesis